jgi:hypothetical protein
VRFWSRRRGWGDIHRLALAAGPLLTYAWAAFPQPPVLPASRIADLIGNVLFAVAAIALVAVAALRLHRQPAGDSEITYDHVAAPDRYPRASSRAG